jgi:hypothetical protein
MENKDKPAVATKIIAGAIAGASETMVTVSTPFPIQKQHFIIHKSAQRLIPHPLAPVPRRIRQNPAPTPSICPGHRVVPFYPSIHLPWLWALGLLLRLRGARREQRTQERHSILVL